MTIKQFNHVLQFSVAGIQQFLGRWGMNMNMNMTLIMILTYRG